MKICRLCLYESDGDTIVSVFDHEIAGLAQKIQDCVSVDINSHENLPKSVCHNCIEQVKQWDTFRNTCKQSNLALLNSLSYKNKNVEQLNDCDDIEIIKQDPHKLNYEFIDFDEFEENFKDEILEDNAISLDESEKYKCEICHLSFDYCFDHLDHQYEHDGKDIFKCDKCQTTFSTRNDIVQHEQTHQYPCEICGILILRSSMKLHLVKHTGRFSCLECNSKFSSNAALKQHIITMHTNIKEFICAICGKRFSTTSSMRVHIKIHSDIRMYKCKKCQYSGRTASALYIHMATHSNEVFICEKCSKTFKSNRNLNDHIRRAHSEFKKHKCNYCHKSFVDKYMLEVHIRWHTNVRPYECSICLKTFTRADGLKEHKQTHTNRTLLECLKCARKFSSRQGIVRHNCLAVT